MGDERKLFIVNTIAGAISPLGQKDAYTLVLEEDASGAIAAFLEDASINVLQASVSGLGTGAMKLTLSNTPAFPANCQYQMLLSKLRPGPVTASDIPANIAVSTVSHSPISSLYHTLKDVFSPMIKEQALGSGMDARLSELLGQVTAGLGVAVRKGAGEQGSHRGTEVSDPNKAPLQDILTPLDEINFWAELASSPSAGPTARSAAQARPLATYIYMYICI
ncbi:MAG: hypothetical protein WDW36_001993 [Sanguina aurantia]